MFAVLRLLSVFVTWCFVSCAMRISTDSSPVCSVVLLFPFFPIVLLLFILVTLYSGLFVSAVLSMRAVCMPIMRSLCVTGVVTASVIIVVVVDFAVVVYCVRMRVYVVAYVVAVVVFVVVAVYTVVIVWRCCCYCCLLVCCRCCPCCCCLMSLLLCMLCMSCFFYTRYRSCYYEWGGCLSCCWC